MGTGSDQNGVSLTLALSLSLSLLEINLCNIFQAKSAPIY
jgi:hypothetical protein